MRQRTIHAMHACINFHQKLVKLHNKIRILYVAFLVPNPELRRSSPMHLQLRKLTVQEEIIIFMNTQNDYLYIHELSSVDELEKCEEADYSA